MGKLPPGQIATKIWPVLSATDTPDIDTSTYALSVTGAVDKEISLSWGQLMKIPKVKRILDYHCVTRWSKLGDEWEGIPIKDILNLAGPKGDYLMLTSSYVNYSANVPISYIDDNCLVAFGWNGKPLEPKHGGPVRACIPTLYFWKSTKWLDGIEVMKEDRPGFWEQRGYNMRGDYWKEERYWNGINFVNKLQFWRHPDNKDE